MNKSNEIIEKCKVEEGKVVSSGKMGDITFKITHTPAGGEFFGGVEHWGVAVWHSGIKEHLFVTTNLASLPVAKKVLADVTSQLNQEFKSIAKSFSFSPFSGQRGVKKDQRAR